MCGRNKNPKYVFSGQKSDVQALKEVNPRLSILVSLGGDIISGDTFRSIVARKDQLSNFTESLNSLYQEQVIQVSEKEREKKEREREIVCVCACVNVCVCVCVCVCVFVCVC